MKKTLSLFSLTAALLLAGNAPALAEAEDPTVETSVEANAEVEALREAATYPRLEVHGYNELYYHLHDFHNLNPFGGLRRDGIYVGQTRLSLQPHFNPRMSGFFEVFLFPKDNPASYVNQMDVVGNGATPSLNPVLGLFTGRMYVSIRDLLWSGNTVQLGQIRNPFGNWDEFSVHRNFVTSKSHSKTLGLLLRRLDLGVSMDGYVGDSPFNYRVAFLNRSDSPTINNAALVDGVARLGVDTAWANLGVNTYVVDVKDAPLGTKGAYGIDYTVPIVDRVNLLGEYVRQVSPTSTTDGLYSRLNVDASDWVPGLRFYTGVDWVNFNGTAAQEVPASGPRNLQEQLQSRVRDRGATFAAGIRYRFLPGATYGMDYFVGDPQYKTGHLHFRLETYF